MRQSGASKVIEDNSRFLKQNCAKCDHFFGGEVLLCPRMRKEHKRLDSAGNPHQKDNLLSRKLTCIYVIESMYGIFTYIYHKNQPSM